jgi:enoyl-CoA hydratase
MPYENIIFKQADGIAILTINRPQALNALNMATIRELCAAIDEIAAVDTIHALIITGAGDRAFVAGADIREFSAIDSAMAGTQLSQVAHAVLQRLVELPKPVIAAINGFALGGGLELALACDIRIAAESAELGFPEITLGLIPGWGGTTRLVRLVGPGRAKLMIMSGERISAAEAMDIGIVERVVPSATVMAHALQVASRFTSLPVLAMAAAKQSINRAHDMALADANAYESVLFGQLSVTEDAREGARAFVEKRPPHWKGR